eukprot:13168949-Alexandrium_andersonii.AAC.1
MLPPLTRPPPGTTPLPGEHAGQADSSCRRGEGRAVAAVAAVAAAQPAPIGQQQMYSSAWS